MDADTDLGVMIDGFRGLIWLDGHSDEVGLGGSCRECSAYVVALLRNADPVEALRLRCAAAQAVQRQVNAAIEVINRRYP